MSEAALDPLAHSRAWSDEGMTVLHVIADDQGAGHSDPQSALADVQQTSVHRLVDSGYERGLDSQAVGLEVGVTRSSASLIRLGCHRWPLGVARAANAYEYTGLAHGSTLHRSLGSITLAAPRRPRRFWLLRFGGPQRIAMRLSALAVVQRRRQKSCGGCLRQAPHSIRSSGDRLKRIRDSSSRAPHPCGRAPVRGKRVDPDILMLAKYSAPREAQGNGKAGGRGGPPLHNNLRDSVIGGCGKPGFRRKILSLELLANNNLNQAS